MHLSREKTVSSPSSFWLWGSLILVAIVGVAGVYYKVCPLPGMLFASSAPLHLLFGFGRQTQVLDKRSATRFQF
jgi:hypothetical protein